MVVAAAVTTVGLTGCVDDTGEESVELHDDVLLSVRDNCVEIDGPAAKGSNCGDPLIVGVSVVGQDGAMWAYGLAPADTERVVFGDEIEDRLLELGNLHAFAVPYQPDAQLTAQNADGETVHVFRLPTR